MSAWICLRPITESRFCTEPRRRWSCAGLSGDAWNRPEPVERDAFDVYIQDGAISYLKAPCEPRDYEAPFFIYVHPVDLDDLHPIYARDGFHPTLSPVRLAERGAVFRRRLPYDAASSRLPRIGDTNGAVAARRRKAVGRFRRPAAKRGRRWSSTKRLTKT